MVGGDNKKQLTKPVLIIELVTILILVIFSIYQSINTKQIELDLAGFQSDYVEFRDGWKIAEDELVLETPSTILTSPEVNAKAGSYTLEIDYNSENQLECQISSNEEGFFVHANKFALSRNRKVVKYDFYVTRNIDDLYVSITGYQSGVFALNGMRLYSNNHNAKLLLLCTIVIFLLIDIVLFTSIWARHAFSASSIILISILVSLPIFIEGINCGHDLYFHLARIEGIAQGIKLGMIPVRMNTFLMDGYGYPTDIFYGGVLLYIPAIFRLLGFSVVSAYKLYVFVISVLTVTLCYFCGNSLFKSERTALVVAFAYAASSYRMVDVWTRSAVGEYTSMAFFPIIALALWNIYTQEINSKAYSKNALVLSFGMLGLLFSHILSTEMAVLVILGIAFVQIKKTVRKETLLVFLKSVIIFLVVGSIFIVPFVDYYSKVDTKIKEIGKHTHFIQSEGAYFSDYFSFFKNVLGNSGDISADRMQFSPGMVLMTGLVIAVFLILIGKGNKKINTLTLGAIVTLFLGSNIFPWNQLAASFSLGNTLAAIQFPWRYIGVSNVFLALLLGELIEYAVSKGFTKNRVCCGVSIAIFITVCIFISSFSSGMSQQRFIDSEELHQYPGGDYSTTNGGEYLINETNVNIIDNILYVENGQVSLIVEDGLNMQLSASMETDSYVVMPRFNYPNYVAIDENGIHHEILSGENNRLKVHFNEPYEGAIWVVYMVPWYWRAAEIISLLTCLAIVIKIIYKKLNI